MKRHHLTLAMLLALSAAGTVGCTRTTEQEQTTATVEAENLSQLFENYFEERLKLFPLEATAIADKRYNDQLPNDLTVEHEQQVRELYQKYLTQINNIDREALGTQEQISYDIFKYEMQMALKGLDQPSELLPLNQFWSLPITMAQLGSGSGNQPFNTPEDYSDFLGRIKGFTVWGDTAIANMRRGMAAGIILPRTLTQKVLPQLQAMVVDDPSKTIFWAPVENLPESFSAAEKDSIRQAYTQAIREEVIPTYKRLYDFMQQEYLPKSRSTTGISGIAGGEDYYRYLVRYWTTTDMTPDEIFEIGEQEVTRIRSEMEKVKEQVGFKGTLKEFFQYVNDNPKFTPFKTPEEVLAAYKQIEQRMQPQLNQLFGITPKSEFEVRQTEAFRAASASAEYNPPAPDGSRPGIFYVPILDASKYNAVGMESLFLHEAIPGHHYQISLQQEQEGLPKFRQYAWYGAFGEGWALYSESLGKELGLYTDPYQYFGRLSDEMHRAIRLVVDVGMHAKGWTREQAIQYSLDNELTSEEAATAEIERYMAIPGQALSYKIGELKMKALRQRAEEELGDKFSISAFHDEILKGGVMPLAVLEKKIEAWIERQKES
ncbi:uncharacterized protein (DUF885 family) [Pontibacter ummariensis]|uniref:Uncharacterized conserved protein, DUF885 familyt n=1 Tax=Pontibacter ummariensis TaxID=1610492 RepID=A0A239J6X9_9BACT|nr:DUF885 domain-containing protein [Pontibacter ummariensis]PRY08910.1 uncharacterized protein (DUF885 family) [Pontibacter ummariensis]SNT01575.1 Uncharacterized conserved protein, DUF885 familyt [Pontibacter ummariensis]